MKTLDEWMTADPEWERLRQTWAGKAADPTLLNQARIAVERLKDSYVRGLGDPRVRTFNDVPPSARDALARAFVVAAVQSFYPAGQPAQPAAPAPQSWKG